MKWNTKRNIFSQATVALILLFSTAVGVVNPTNPSADGSSSTVETVFHYEDLPYITVTVTPPSLVFGHHELDGQLLATLQLPDEGVTTVVGEAQLPTISRFLEIPHGATPQLFVASVSWETTSLEALGLPSLILPVQPSLVKIEGATVRFCKDETFYATDAFLPSVIADVHVLGEMRGRTIAFLQISPVQYNPVSGELYIMTRCDIRIDLPGSDFAKTVEKIDRYTTSSFEGLFKTSFVNYGALQGTESKEPTQEGFLIIVYDTFFDAIVPFAEWKEIMGYDLTVTKTSEIPGGPTKEKIKAYIADAYNNWTVPPAYVLLVGDVEQIPTWTGTKTGTVTDLYYVTVDQGNYFADIIISRFSAANPGHVTAMVDKTVYYEQGIFGNDSWIKKAAFIASNDMGGMAEQTHNYVIDNYLLPSNYTCDKIYESTGGSTSQITNALNDGRSLCVYSGHGYSGGWGCVPFNQNNVQNLQNQGMYPFVCSHACSTSPFNNAECFGETWLRVENKGGIAFWGASASTYWDEDDILEKRMFKAWWEDDLETIGGMTNMALFYLYQHYSGGGLTQYYFEAYNVLGDSSVKIWRESSDYNTPPATPSAPDGPTEGEIGVEYTFTTSTTDVQNDEVYYMVSWGDSVSDWFGPYASGEIVGFSHAWSTVGSYRIEVKAKDAEGLESEWSEPLYISIVLLPRIEIGEIMGGWGLTAVIKNVGTADAADVAWSIRIFGGVILRGRETGSSISMIPAGLSENVKTGFMFGFGVGLVGILVVAGDVQKTARALLLGPFVLIQ